MTGPAATHGVTPTARVLVGAATATLPSGAVRERYRLEHLGELSALPATHQVRYAVGALSTSWALRRALSMEKDMTTTPTRPSKPLLCRLNLRHRWHAEHNPMGESYRRCQKCGKDDFGDPRGGTPNPKRPAMPFG
ncbi:MAG TPA: hypothetical protein VLQ78_08855 [Ornithinibacter sp.]|nr:hypothetical protein [Ornithinibacter sp.]